MPLRDQPDTGRHHLHPNVRTLAGDPLDPDRMSARRAVTVRAQRHRSTLRAPAMSPGWWGNRYLARHALDGGDPVVVDGLAALNRILDRSIAASRG